MIKPKKIEWQDIVASQFTEIRGLIPDENLLEGHLADVLRSRYPSLDNDELYGRFAPDWLANVYVRDAKGQVFLQEHPKKTVAQVKRQAK